MQLKTGDRIGDYEVLGVLGAGGMGSVYKVRNVISDRVEAVKLLLPNLVEHQDLKERFLREIKTSASLEHPAIASLRTAFQSGDMLLMVMEFVDGQTLDARLRKGPLTVQEAVRITASVLDALEFAHSRGVVHRDIKPANIMLATKGGVKLLDFGIAKATTDKQITVAGTTMGSLYYMSPEQIRGEQVDARADLYSLGITLYELSTGKRPFGGDSGYAIMAEHLQKQPVPPLELVPALPPALSMVILRSLAKNPDDRYQSAAEFRQDLNNVLAPEEATRIVSKFASHTATMPAATPPLASTPVAPPVLPPQVPPMRPPVATAGTPPPENQTPVAFRPRDPHDTPASVPPASATPRKPSNTLALAMVAVIAFLVLAAVVLVFAGSWFFGSSGTTTASNQPGLIQRIGGLFASSSSKNVPASAVPPDSREPAGREAQAGDVPTTEQSAAALAPNSTSAALAANASSSGSPALNTSVRAPMADSMQSDAAVTAGNLTRAGSGAARPRQTANPAVAQLSRGRDVASPVGTPSVASGDGAGSLPAHVAPDGPSPEAVEVARDFFSKLGIRAGTVQESARKLSEEQSSLGVSLRADMRAALKRMEYLMDQAEASLNRGNLQQARQHMQGAEREIEKLEKFFRI